MVYPFKQFLQNLAWGKESQVRTLTPNFYRFGFINVGLQSEKSLKLVIFGIYLPKGVYPLHQFFIQNLAWGRDSQVPTIMLTFTFVALKCSLTADKIAKNSNFWYKFTPTKKSRGSIEKLEYRCTTRNLHLCNGTIIVLKITLLHSVSVITNFVIPKRDKTNKITNKKNITHFRLQPACDPRSPP